MLLRKQTSFSQTFEVTMEFNPQQVGCEAGLVLWWNQFSYATIGVRLGGNTRDSRTQHVVYRSPKGQPGEFSVRFPWPIFWTIYANISSVLQTTSSVISASSSNTTEPVKLSVICEGSKHTLTFHQGNGGAQEQAPCSSEDLTIMPPVGGAFTGVMFGIYSFGLGQPVLDPADFTDIRVSTRAS